MASAISMIVSVGIRDVAVASELSDDKLTCLRHRSMKAETRDSSRVVHGDEPMKKN